MIVLEVFKACQESARGLGGMARNSDEDRGEHFPKNYKLFRNKIFESEN